MFDTTKEDLGRRIARAENRLDRLIRSGGSTWSSPRYWLSSPQDWLSSLWPSRSQKSWSAGWPQGLSQGWSWPWSDRSDSTVERVGSATRSAAEELMRLGAAAAASGNGRRPVGKVLLVAAGLGLLAAWAARRDHGHRHDM